jgi:hypothetical protein
MTTIKAQGYIDILKNIFVYYDRKDVERCEKDFAEGEKFQIRFSALLARKKSGGTTNIIVTSIGLGIEDIRQMKSHVITIKGGDELTAVPFWYIFENSDSIELFVHDRDKEGKEVSETLFEAIEKEEISIPEFGQGTPNI